MNASRRDTRARRKIVLGTAAVLGLATTHVALAGALPGGVYVERIGGTGAFGNGSTQGNNSTALPVFVDSFSVTGAPTTPQYTVSLPTADATGPGGQPIHAVSMTAIESASGPINYAGGIMQGSPNGRFLAVGGYDDPSSGGNIRTSGGVKTLASIDATTGSINSSLNFNSSVNARSNITQDGTNFWFAGATGGINYVTPTAPPVTTTPTGSATLVSPSNMNQRITAIYGGQLFLSGNSSVSRSGSITNPGVSALGIGNVTVGGTGGVPVNNTAGNFQSYLFQTNSNPEQFVLLDQTPASFVFGGVDTKLDTAYVGTDAGVEKWVYNGTAWSRPYSINAGLSTDPTSKLFGTSSGAGGIVGLTYAGKDASGNNIIYGTTVGNYNNAGSPEGNALVKLVDTGAGATWAIVAYSPDNTWFRGLALIKAPGDANGDWKISGDDYTLIDRGFARYAAGTIPANTAGWTDGDFNYDGQVTSADYLIIDTAYGHQLGMFSPGFLAARQSEFGDAYVADLVAAVPEPSSLLAAAGLALLPLARRRGR